VTESARQLESLLQLVARLRDPQRGCAWDRAQTFATIAPYTIEEAYELAEAVAQSDQRALLDELGDLLFQVAFHARLAEEQGWGDFASVARGVHDKLVQRHPHVFADQAVESAQQLNALWEQSKRAERQARGESGALTGVALALPALSRAAKLSRRAAGVGFDWPDAAGARAKVAEELAEFDAAATHSDAPAMAEELGDLLLAVANLARLHHIDAETALRAANQKFERRFRCMEQLAAARQLELSSLDAARWDELWNAAKLVK
jgi:MazG family protein